MLPVGRAVTAAGLGAEAAGICPIVKPIWTPAWTLYSGGICFLFLLGFTLLFDNGTPLRCLAFPLVVMGANSIFIYCLPSRRRLDAATLATHLALPERHGTSRPTRSSARTTSRPSPAGCDPDLLAGVAVDVLQADIHQDLRELDMLASRFSPLVYLRRSPRSPSSKSRTSSPHTACSARCGLRTMSIRSTNISSAIRSRA